MIGWGIAYGVVALIVTLSFAAWDNGKRWDTTRYIFLGATFPVSLLFTLAIVLIKKHLRGKTQ